MSKEELKERILTLLESEQNKVIKPNYADVITETFENLYDNEDTAGPDVAEEMLKIFDLAVTSATKETNMKTVAGLIMVNLSTNKVLSIAHSSVLITLISLTFTNGPELIYQLNKYNSHVLNICLQSVQYLTSLESIRANIDNEQYRRADVSAVKDIMQQQINQL